MPQPFRAVLSVLILCQTPFATGQTVSTQTAQSRISDPQAAALVQQANYALTGGLAVTDTAMNASAVWFLGSTNASGTATLQAKGSAEARLDISAAAISRTEIGNSTNGPTGQWMGSDGTAHPIAFHNCLRPGAWFSPISVVQAASASNALVQYIAAETRNSIPVDHLRLSIIPAPFHAKNVAATTAELERLSAIEIYLDSNSHLPLAFTWNQYPDSNDGWPIPFEARFAAYQVTAGIRAPFRIQRLINGSLNLDLSITSVGVNTGVSDSTFALQAGGQQ